MTDKEQELMQNSEGKMETHNTFFIFNLISLIIGLELFGIYTEILEHFGTKYGYIMCGGFVIGFVVWFIILMNLTLLIKNKSKRGVKE